MITKIKLSGGDWYSDDDLIWQGELPQLLSVGDVFTINIARFKYPVKIVLRSVDIETVEYTENITYVFYVNPFYSKDEEAINDAVRGKKMDVRS